MTKIIEKRIFPIFFLCFLMAAGVIFPSLTEADLSVMVKNETGYDLEEVKYVQEMGTTKTLVGQTQNLANGKSYSFSFRQGGAYRIYASFTMGGKKIYAKGNNNSMTNGARYELTLTKVIFSDGAGLKFIDKGEFYAIK